ncbi:T9SS type B sorting domain-containing protein, partial [uncultured Tenacibaculum sp.]|uniref:T9SS type B sorting domain-containing protein n=1 Tax=uncultured Tenacibaculum sp. TaxID=174713 RepID=UPI002632F32B
CNGSATGRIEVTLTAGLTPVTYSLVQTVGSGLAAGQGVYDAGSDAFINVPAGTYTVTATGDNGCTTDVTGIVIGDNPLLTVVAPSAVQFGCSTGNTVDNATLSIDTASGSGISGGSTVYNTVELYLDVAPFGDFDTSLDTEITAVTVTGTVYTYSISDTTGGNYYIRVLDSEGCESFSPVTTINAFDELQDITPSQNDAISCVNGGELIDIVFNSSLTVTGATITILDDTGATIETINNVDSGVSVTNTTRLAVGVYTINVTHPTTGCELTTTYNVEEIIDHIINVSQTAPVVCFGSSTAEVEIVFDASSPYAGGYTYTVFDAGTGTATAITGTGTSGNTPETITGLPAGDYFVRVVMTAFPDCTRDTGTFTIAGPTAALNATLTTTPINCATNDSGEVTINAVGGWNGYEYQLVNTTTSTTVQAFGTNNIIGGLTAGTYEVTVRDANGCPFVDTFTLTDPTIIDFVPQVTTQIECEGDETAVVTVTGVTGGAQVVTPVYSYSLEFPDGTSTAIQSSNVFSGLGAGTYQVTVYDEFNCRNTLSVIVNEPTEVVATAIVTGNITCTVPNATVEVSGVGGTGTYEYSIDGTTFVASNVFTVPAGDYNFYVRDNNDCISAPFVVSIPALEPLVATLDASLGFITCNGNADAVLSATTVGGLGSNMYELIDVDTSTSVAGPQADNIFRNIGPGRYLIRVTSLDCTADTGEVRINDPDVLVTTPTVVNVSCNGSTDGSITLNTIGGTGAYVYEINTAPGRFQSENVFNNLAAGMYRITVLDENGCPNILDVEVLEPAVLDAEIDLTTVVQQPCVTDPAPSFTVNIMGGTPPYTLRLSDGSAPITLGPTETSYTYNNLNSGQSYAVIVTDSRGCRIPDPLRIQFEPAVDLGFEELNVTYDCTQQATITATVAEIYRDEVVYMLTGPESASNDTGIFQVNTPGTYIVEVTHAVGLGCTPPSEQITVISVSPLVFTEANIDQSQLNTLIANATGGIAPYEYSIDGSEFTSNNVFTINQTRNYVITVRDDRGCEETVTVRGEFITIDVPNYFTPDGDSQQDYWYPINVQPYHNLKVYIYDRYGRQLQLYSGMQQGWDGTYQGRPLPSGDYWYTIEFTEITGEEKRLIGHFTLYR